MCQYIAFYLVWERRRLFKLYTEILHGIYTQENIEMMIEKGEMVSFKAKRPMVVGKRDILKVNVNIGVSDISMYKF